jgi:uncharacterized protein (TIGR02391 family)
VRFSSGVLGAVLGWGDNESDNVRCGCHPAAVGESLPPFSSAQLTQLSQILAETTTGSELDRLLAEARIETGEPSTKWRRLRKSLEREQRRSRSGNAVAQFVKLALDPANFIGRREEFEGFRAAVNQTLGFSELRLEADGRLIRVPKTRTLDEAEERADRLRAKLSARQVHPDVLAHCRPELTQHNYFHAVLEAAKSVFEKIRQRTGLTADGAALIDEAFALRNPALLFNDLTDDTERSEHVGLATMAKAMCSIYRNPTAHAPRARWAIDEREALDMLTIASMLHRRLDQARRAPGAPSWSQAA